MTATNQSKSILKLEEPILETQTMTTDLISSTGKTHSSSSSPPIVYGELSILGYNGYIPNPERTGRRNRSKFLLCKRPTANGIKKSRHYIVKQPQANNAIQDKDLHSISYTFSRSQTIIVEYGHDEYTDMFQIGRSSEDPIDFVVMDTLANAVGIESSSSNHQPQASSHTHNENITSNQSQSNNEMLAFNRYHRQLAKVGEEMLHYGAPPPAHDHRNRNNFHRHHAQAVLLNYPQPNISNLPPMMADHFRYHGSIFQLGLHPAHDHHHPPPHHQGQPSSAHQHPQLHHVVRDHTPITSDQFEHCSSRNNITKRSHATQSTISRFACRILVDRKPPYTARIYAAGFDSSKNIFLGEKATKWKKDDTIDGLTTNGVLLMHPKQGNFYEEFNANKQANAVSEQADAVSTRTKLSDIRDRNVDDRSCSTNEFSCKDALEVSVEVDSMSAINDHSSRPVDLSVNKAADKNETATPDKSTVDSHKSGVRHHGGNLNCDKKESFQEQGGVWREVSVDGGIYAIRESRSAAQKGIRMETEDNILKDGTLIDLCGSTLLWRSVDGFRASPTKQTLEEKIDKLNASRPQCPVGLNTLVIPRKPIPPSSHHKSGHKDHHHHHHHSRDSDKNSHQPYVYLKCGHVQGYHDWGATEKSNQRTCPICMNVGTVAKLSMGLEPSFYVDSGPLSHVFNPCGHMASEKTVKYWCSIKIPHGTHFFHSICPFCAVPLASSESNFTKLIFQDDLD